MILGYKMSLLTAFAACDSGDMQRLKYSGSLIPLNSGPHSLIGRINLTQYVQMYCINPPISAFCLIPRFVTCYKSGVCLLKTNSVALCRKLPAVYLHKP